MYGYPLHRREAKRTPKSVTGSTAMSKRMNDTLLHNEQTALGRDQILTLRALLTKAGLLDVSRVS